jgi:hypothetical protein
VTSTYTEAVFPCCTELGTRSNFSESVGFAGGGGGGFGVGDGLGLGGGSALGVDGAALGVDGSGVGVAEGELDADFVGVGDVVEATAAEAVPLTRTRPVPTPMISGLRTDRASTAYDLLNDRRCRGPWLGP